MHQLQHNPMDAKIWPKTLKEELHHTAPGELICLPPTDQQAVDGHNKQHGL